MINRTIFDKPVVQEPVANKEQVSKPKKEQPPKPEPKSVVKPKLQIKVRAPVEKELTGMESDDEFKESEEEYEESEELLNESSFDSVDEDEMITPRHKSTKRSRFVESSDDEFSFSPDTDSASKRKK